MPKILVIGALGQIGTALTEELCVKHGESNVIAADNRLPERWLRDGLAFEQLNVLEEESLKRIVEKHNVSEIYLLAAILSGSGERNPGMAWRLNMQSLMHCLELARKGTLCKLFWPSSIAVFGPDAPIVSCPQGAVQHPITIYGVSKSAGENLCAYYHKAFGVDVRSLRYPGLVSHESAPGGGTTDYAVEIYHAAIRDGLYRCYLDNNTKLPIMYMPDAVRATMELMEARPERLTVHTSYNIASMSISPQQMTQAIRKLRPNFIVSYAPDYRQAIAESWPTSLDDAAARKDWSWRPLYNLESMTRDMFKALASKNVFRSNQVIENDN